MSNNDQIYKRILETIVDQDKREILPPRQTRIDAASRYLIGELGNTRPQTETEG